MNYIDVNDVLYEYFLRDSEGNVEAIKKALESVNLSVKEGDFISIIGANGSGKSTLARLLNALIVPAEGTVYVKGLDSLDPDNTLTIRQINSMVFQNPDNQIVSGVVEEDVAFGLENIGVEPSAIRQRVGEALEKMGLIKKRRSAPGKLSGGEKQKLAIAGVLAMESKCIILDEATAMLDPGARKEIISTVTELNKKNGITVILITHNIEETICSDYIYVMEEGHVIREGRPGEIFSDPAYLFEHKLQVPPIVLLADRLRSSGVDLPEGILDAESLVKALERIKKNVCYS